MQFLLDMCDIFGDEYVTLMILPIFLEAVGDHADLSLLPMKMHSKIRSMSLSHLNHHDIIYVNYQTLIIIYPCSSSTQNSCNGKALYSLCFTTTTRGHLGKSQKERTARTALEKIIHSKCSGRESKVLHPSCNGSS